MAAMPCYRFQSHLGGSLGCLHTSVSIFAYLFNKFLEMQLLGQRLQGSLDTTYWSAPQPAECPASPNHLPISYKLQDRPHSQPYSGFDGRS